MELLIALMLFVALIVAWLLLPGSTTTRMPVGHDTPAERAAVQQPA
ncbi:hypothetical protein [Kallotenue papyrolyticum]|nr:hypothetical protein [Kallotenue papyrolyticum]